MSKSAKDLIMLLAFVISVFAVGFMLGGIRG